MTDFFTFSAKRDIYISFSVTITDTDNFLSNSNGMCDLQVYSDDNSINIIDTAPTFAASFGSTTRCISYNGMLKAGTTLKIRAMQATVAARTCILRAVLLSNIAFTKS